MLGLMAKKIGMTQLFDDAGNLVPVSVIQIEPNTVVAKKATEKDGYNAVVLGIEDVDKSKVSKPYGGQFPEAVTPKKILKEFRDFEKEVAIGDVLTEELLENTRYVDITGISKGKGFAGVIKRWHFGGGRSSHGSKFHREAGSTGQSTYPHKTFKNMKLPGRMGRERTTVLNQRVIKVDKTRHLIMVNGNVPGSNKGLVIVRAAVKK
jgi:large subunit ribosomal protein L3